jgi:hypothetical protein
MAARPATLGTAVRARLHPATGPAAAVRADLDRAALARAAPGLASSGRAPSARAACGHAARARMRVGRGALVRAALAPASAGLAPVGPAAFGPAGAGPGPAGPAAFGPAGAGPAALGPALTGLACAGRGAPGPVCAGRAKRERTEPGRAGPALAGTRRRRSVVSRPRGCAAASPSGSKRPAATCSAPGHLLRRGRAGWNRAGRRPVRVRDGRGCGSQAPGCPRPRSPRALAVPAPAGAAAEPTASPALDAARARLFGRSDRARTCWQRRTRGGPTHSRQPRPQRQERQRPSAGRKSPRRKGERSSPAWKSRTRERPSPAWKSRRRVQPCPSPARMSQRHRRGRASRGWRRQGRRQAGLRLGRVGRRWDRVGRRWDRAARRWRWKTQGHDCWRWRPDRRSRRPTRGCQNPERQRHSPRDRRCQNRWTPAAAGCSARPASAGQSWTVLATAHRWVAAASSGAACAPAAGALRPGPPDGRCPTPAEPAPVSTSAVRARRREREPPTPPAARTALRPGRAAWDSCPGRRRGRRSRPPRDGSSR